MVCVPTLSILGVLWSRRWKQVRQEGIEVEPARKLEAESMRNGMDVLEGAVELGEGGKVRERKGGEIEQGDWVIIELREVVEGRY